MMVDMGDEEQEERIEMTKHRGGGHCAQTVSWGRGPWPGLLGEVRSSRAPTETTASRRPLLSIQQERKSKSTKTQSTKTHEAQKRRGLLHVRTHSTPNNQLFLLARQVISLKKTLSSTRQQQASENQKEKI
jgi:hypothetical protein